MPCLDRGAQASGALASRFIVMPLTNSFYGREDLGLTDRLLGELSAILSWAISGWQRLRERGYFVQPKSAARVSAPRIRTRRSCLRPAGSRSSSLPSDPIPASTPASRRIA